MARSRDDEVEMNGNCSAAFPFVLFIHHSRFATGGRSMRRSTSGVTTMNLCRMARNLAVLILGVLLFSNPRPVQAQTWNGSVSDLWNNASNWSSPSTVPNSATADVVITNATNNPVLLNIVATVGNLQTGASNSLTIGNGEQLTVSGTSGFGTLNNAGTITLGSTGSNTYLQITGTVTNTGGGSITLSNLPNDNFIYGAGGTLINDTANTIQGAGAIGDGYSLTINNKGTIDANVSNSLTINPSVGMTNTGTLEATTGGTLNLPVAITNTGGTILSTGSGSLVNLNTGSVTGGTLTTTSGGTMYVGGSTLSGVTISTGTTATVQNDSVVTLAGRAHQQRHARAERLPAATPTSRLPAPSRTPAADRSRCQTCPTTTLSSVLVAR